jgi:hypothetical protein
VPSIAAVVAVKAASVYVPLASLTVTVGADAVMVNVVVEAAVV